MDVAEADWPAEQDAVADLRRRGVPRLLHLASGAAPPPPVDGLEDWVGPGADPAEVAARRAGLEVRARIFGVRPQIEDRVLRFRGATVPLSPVEAALATALGDRFGAVVSRDALAAAAWPGGLPTRNALDVHVLRLRRRIAPVGLRITTVRARGYLLDADPAVATGPNPNGSGPAR